MKKYHVLYNPLAAKGHGLGNAKKLQDILKDGEIHYEDMTRISDHRAYLESIPLSDDVIFTGGDGTLNLVINTLYHDFNDRPIYYYPAGSGNDFMKDLEKQETSVPFLLNDYIRELPTVTLDTGESCRFVNAIGYGLDGYCCEEADRLRARGKTRSYTMIAFLGLMGKYRPCGGSVTVDGVTQNYRKIWMAPLMFGRYYGGGVLMAPMQKRNNPEQMLTSVVIHDLPRLRTLFLFPAVCKGKGEKYPDCIAYRRGHEITVRFDREVALQIDGETRLGIRSCTVRYPDEGGTV